jgi:predicted nucleic acid-binding protein
VTDAVYLDTSALVKLVAAEPESAALVRHLRDRPMQIASSITIVEFGRAIARKPGIDPTRALEIVGRIVLVDLDRRIIDRAAGLAPAELRSLDAIHLATAIDVRDSIEAVVTYDARFAAAARTHGFTVIAPA